MLSKLDFTAKQKLVLVYKCSKYFLFFRVFLRYTVVCMLLDL